MRSWSLMALAATAVAGVGCGGSDSEPDRRSTPPRPADTRLVAMGRAGPLVGLADNRPETFDDVRFQATGIQRTRVVVPYDDAAAGGERRAVQDRYFRAARRYGAEPLVSFYRSYAHPERLPSAAQFRAAVGAFRRRYPWVRHFSTWSEPNSGVQPTARAPERAAAYYRVLRRECRGGRCTATTGDFRLDSTRESARWLKRFQRAIGPGPHIWGLSAFEDAEKRSTRLTRAFLSRTRGPVWVGETGAVYASGRRVRPQPQAQGRQMAFLVDRYAAVSGRIERMYVYHWRSAGPAERFDSALLDLKGRARPAYWEFTRGIGRLSP